jgi:HAD superfamily hydrolase (TIGR01490 family)
LKPRLALFDLDHTLLDGDSDVLWCDFLVAHGLLDGDDFGRRSAGMAHAYRAGTVAAEAFCGFYVGTLAGRTRAEWEPHRRRFVDEVVVPRIPDAARALLRRHVDGGELVVLTTATNRFVTEPTAEHLGLAELIATECELDADGRFTGRTAGVVNMREGKVTRLAAWLAARGLALGDCDTVFYSDSINDLPLLRAVGRAVAVDPDDRLAAEAAARGWPVISLHRRAAR